ncbi:hypothetical protein MRX96_045037 [Rhipicephalus microplus]
MPKNVQFPSINQNFEEKAVAMFRGCISFVAANVSEAHYLVEWMTIWGLDLHRLDDMENMNPVDTIVRFSLDLGVQAVIVFRTDDRYFVRGKRVLWVEYSKSLKEWIESREYFTTNDRTRGYSTLLQVWGDRSNITSIAKKIVEYEDKLAYIQNSDYITPRERRLLLRPIHFMGSITTPYVTSVEWSRYVSKYTNNVYRGKDMIMLRFPVLNILVEILKSPSLGRKGLMYLVFWSIYTQLEHYTNPLNYGEEEIYVLRTCYKRVYAVLSVPLTNPYLQTVVRPEMLSEAVNMTQHIRQAFKRAFLSSQWIRGKTLGVALRKLANLKFHVGPPQSTLEVNRLEEYYGQ